MVVVLRPLGPSRVVAGLGNIYGKAMDRARLSPRRSERFQAKWKPVRVKKTRQTKILEPRFDSIEAERLPARCKAAVRWQGKGSLERDRVHGGLPDLRCALAFGANQVVPDRLGVVGADRSLVGRDHLVDDFLPGRPRQRRLVQHMVGGVAGKAVVVDRVRSRTGGGQGGAGGGIHFSRFSRGGLW